MDTTPTLPETLIAAKHPTEYLLHKYWARKPHNVVADFLHTLVPPGGHVLDPFCGSGVILAEARAMGLQATGIDLNPAAVMLASVTTAPPEPDAFNAALTAFLQWSREALQPLYTLPDGTEMRYCVHAMRVNCPACAVAISAWDIRQQGRKRRCPACGGVLRFNLSTLHGTDITAVVTTAGGWHDDPAILAHQQTAAYRDAIPRSDSPLLLPNRRILAWEDMHAADLFTPRNYHAAALLREGIRSGDPPIDNARTAMVTASLAGFSRLIAYRNGLRGGGPAWSVPGFWVAPIHVEHNPLPLLESRARRYRTGIARLWRRVHRGATTEVFCGAAQNMLVELQRQRRRYDLIFLDPPYGDSVPYLEFSALWNAFLAGDTDIPAEFYQQEVVVSNRTRTPAGWTLYEQCLCEVVAGCECVLASAGAVLVTFNNLDGRAWAAMLGALHAAGLRCESVHYVAPAVVSAKAQFAPAGSYQGDFWCVFRRGSVSELPESAWASVWQRTVPADIEDAQQRRRLALRAILLANLPAKAVLTLDS